MLKGTTAGGRTKGDNDVSVVYVDQHDGNDVTYKPPLSGADPGFSQEGFGELFEGILPWENLKLGSSET